MPAHRTTTTRASARTSAPLPKGARIPQPALVVYLARSIFIGALLLFLATPFLLTWARAHELPSASAGQHSGLLTSLLPAHATPAPASGAAYEHIQAEDRIAPEHSDQVAPLIATLVIAVFTPHVVRAAGLLGAVGLGLMLGEALLALWGWLCQRRALPRIPTIYLLVRAPMPGFSASGRLAGSAANSGDELFRAIQRAVPSGSSAERFRGRAPWVAFTLTGVPDQPVELGLVVADGDARRRAETAAAIRATIQGQLPGALVDEQPDPLHAALALGTTIAWREYGLKLAPHYPLRFLDDIAGSDLLGPLAAALAPRGTLCTEAQIVLRPARRWALNWGWRGHATALLLTLQAKADYALSEDTRRIEAKIDAPPFEATIRIAAVATGDDASARLDAALNEVAKVLGQYDQDTSHYTQQLIQIGAGQARIADRAAPLAVQTRAPRFAPPPSLLLPIRPWRALDILTTVEIAGLWHAPSPGLGALIRWLPCKIIPAPPHAFIPPNRADRIIVGQAKRADGTIGPVGPTLRDLRPPLHITAGMGAGKSRALANICQQCIPPGFILLDGKGDDQGGSLAATVRHYIPLADEQRLILFDILDTDWPIGLNPLAGIDLARPGAKDQALGQIMAIFARLDPATWGKAPAMKEFVQMATLLVLESEPTPTLAHIKQCLLDSAYRATLLPHCTNVDVLTFWTITFPAQGETQRTSLHALLRRFSQLLTSETTRYLVSQPTVQLNLRDAIETGMIVLAPLPHVTLGDLASAVGMLLLQQFVRAAFSRPGNDQTRTTYPLIIDELQVFIGEGESADIQNAITQLRGLGIAGIYAHQTLDQLGELKDEMLTNSGSRLILRTQEPDASTYARLYAESGISAIDVAGQDEQEHQYAMLRCDGARTGLFSMLVLPWPRPLEISTAAYDGPDWQMQLPPDSPDVAFDRELVQLIYHPVAYPAELVRDMAGYEEQLWQRVLDRWAAIRAYHRGYILEHPGCIADRLERQRWLSRLLVATPRVLAAVEYTRIRRQIEPEDGQIQVERRGGRGKGQAGPAPLIVQTAQGEMVVASPVLATPAEEIVPIGFVSGATPQPGTTMTVPQIADARTFTEVMEQRGRRRARNELASGFDDLLTAGDEEEAAL